MRAPLERAPHRKMRRLVTLRLPAFRFLHLLFLKFDRAKLGVTEDRKAGPTPALSLDRTGFALDVTTFLQARVRSLSRAEKLGRRDVPRERRCLP